MCVEGREEGGGEGGRGREREREREIILLIVFFVGLSTSSSRGLVGALIGLGVICFLLAILSIGLIIILCHVYCVWCRKHRKSSYVSDDISKY